MSSSPAPSTHVPSTAASNCSREEVQHSLKSLEFHDEECQHANNQKEIEVEPCRYKTKLCRNFQRNGFCPYETRCMFAHGPFDLRTVEENVAEGLDTEAAIKRRQKQLAYVARMEQSAAPYSTYDNYYGYNYDPSYTYGPSYSYAPYGPYSTPATGMYAAGTTEAPAAGPYSSTPYYSTHPPVYTHDPYASAEPVA